MITMHTWEDLMQNFKRREIYVFFLGIVLLDLYPMGVYNRYVKRRCEMHQCEVRHKKRTADEQKKLVTRLKRIEGQVRGIQKMVEDDLYCPDILVQVSAVTSALNSFNKELLACHIRGCVATDIRQGKDESIDELVTVLQKLMK